MRMTPSEYLGVSEGLTKLTWDIDERFTDVVFSSFEYSDGDGGILGETGCQGQACSLSSISSERRQIKEETHSTSADYIVKRLIDHILRVELEVRHRKVGGRW
jgi:hypothetical protein